MTVEQVTRNIHELNGKSVTVAGYLGECFGYECVLYTDKVTEQRAQAFIREIIRLARDGKMHETPDGPSPFASLGIGAGEWLCDRNDKANCHSEFDRKAAPFRYSYVLISGEVTDQCRDKDGTGGCTDRSTDLKPRSIRPWTRAGNA